MKTKKFWGFASAILIGAVALGAKGQSVYFNAITNLNPAGYWPMHEVEAAAQGDIETNYGTLGSLGEGLYPDWAGSTVGIKRGVPGALFNDTDAAVYFNYGGSPGAGTYTNVLLIPHLSPLLTLNPPFSVECWVFPTNQNNQAIWSSSGFEGLNAGGTGGGVGQCAGITLQWNGTNTGFQVYNYFNSSTLNTEGFSGATNVPNNTPLKNWYHVVVTCDSGTNINLYVNNVQGLYAHGVPNGLMDSVPAVGLYTPDYWSAFQVGGGRGNTRSFPGYLDEFAIYTNVLGDVGTHYNDGISGGPGQYFFDVTNDNPVVYLRMDAPAIYAPPAVGAWPVLTNYGTTNGVAIANGVYSPGTMPGLINNSPVNPNGVPFGGVPGHLVALNGVSSFADAGYASAYNPIGPTPFSVTALFRGNPCDGRMNTIIGHSDNSWNLSLNTTGHLFWRFGTNTTANLNSFGAYNDGLWHQVVAVYTPNANLALPGTNALYVDGQLDIFTNDASVNGLLPGTNTDVFIGSDPQYTNNPFGVGRNFAGRICDVAIFTNALTASQVTMLYSNCGVVPIITTQPQSSYITDQGADFASMSVAATGSGALSYQWYTNGVALSGQNASNLVLNPAEPANGDADYYVIVSNLFGSVTSAVSSLTVFAAPTFTSYRPVTYVSVAGVAVTTNFMNLYAGANPVFKVAANGAQPVGLFWFTNGVNVPGQNGANLAFTNVSLGTFNVSCVASNFLGVDTNVWSVTVLGDPTNNANGLAPYPQQVLADNPMGYWRLNDYLVEGDNLNGDDGYIAYDYAGGDDGIYTNVYLGPVGGSSYNPTTDPSDSPATFGEFGNLPANNEYAGQIQGIDFAVTNGANAEFTVEAWANGSDSGSQAFQQTEGGALATKGIYGVDDEFNLGIDSTKKHYRFYVRGANGNQYTVGSGSMPALDGQWHHVLGVCDEANGLLSLYYDGVLVNTASIPVNSGIYEAPEPMSIGASTVDGVNYGNQFVGGINDVAVYNYAFNYSEVEAQYSSGVPGGVPPYFLQAPPSFILVNLGGTLVLPAVAAGATPMGYYWTDVNASTNVAAAATNGLPLNAALTVSNVPSAWNGDQLELTVTNASGSTNVYVSIIVNTNAPKIALTLDLPSPVTVVSGKSYVYAIGATGPTPFSYQWYNAGTAIGGATNTTYTVTAGSPGSTTYYVVVTNLVGVITSTVSTFNIINPPAAPTFAYATNLLQFNPVGYWPMHETEAAAQGDVEVNYGSLGPLGDGFYPDWAANYGSFVRNVPGVLNDDSDTALNFTRGGASNAETPAGSTTNDVFIPNASSQATLVPPFSVECWFYPTNVNSQDIWDQCGDIGLNAGNPTANLGAGAAGIRLVWLNGTTTGFEIYTLNNGVQNNVGFTGTSGGNASPINNWYHLVVTCDASTNISIYINGLQAPLNNIGGTPVNNPASYAPDYWTPITIGGGRGGTRAVAGYLDEFAIYTNVLTTNAILQHYYDAVGGNPGQYFTDTRNANPVIYLRMDASNYLASATNFWPTLFNYGSAGINGLYTPGTVPGILPGPSTNASGATLNGLSGNVPMLSGVSSFADAGYAPAFNPTGTVPFSVSAMFRGNPCDNRFQDIVGHSDNSWRIAMDDNGHLQCSMGIDPSNVVNSAGLYNDGNWHQAVDVYTPASNPNVTGTNSLYVDGVLDTTVTGVNTHGIGPGTTQDVMIGSDPQYTNTPTGAGREFAGQVCEVALFTNALNAGEVSALYAAALNPNQVPAYVAPEPPLNVTVAPGASLSLTAGAAGTSQVGYLWQINTNGGGSAVLQSGAGNSPLSANLTLPNVPLALNGSQLELTVTNAFGTNSVSVTLSVVNPVNPNPTNIVATVTNNNLYLTWPADHTGWQLQALTNAVNVGIITNVPIGNNWANDNPSTGTNQVVIPVNLTNGTVFYRLTY